MTKNWGRWGPTDERGSLNLVDEAACLRGMAAVLHGKSVSLGLPVDAKGPRAGFRPSVQHYFTRHGGDYAAGLEERPGYGFADDVVVLPCHGTTHLDALSHVWQDHAMWNGYSASSVTSRGAQHAGIQTAGPFVTRGLFVDASSAESGPLTPGTPISVAAIERALDANDLVPEPGDALLVRTGWLRDWRAGVAVPEVCQGLTTDLVAWIDEHDVAVVGADNVSVEVQPSGVEGSALPLHLALSRDRGVPFLELLDLETLAEHGVTSFMLTVAPLNIVGGSGSPVAPVATF